MDPRFVQDQFVHTVYEVIDRISTGFNLTLPEGRYPVVVADLAFMLANLIRHNVDLEEDLICRMFMVMFEGTKTDIEAAGIKVWEDLLILSTLDLKP